jgi:type I restriction enzyme, S subunit
MYKGDVLFAKRNAYLKRVAIAPHDGLFSAHGMVLRANEEVLLHEFLPFFMQSDYFWDRAIQISVGSLSPTINWTTLAGEEFVLPPMEEQYRLVHTLAAVESCSDEYFNAIAELTNVRRSTEAAVIGWPLGLEGATLDLRHAKPQPGWTVVTGQELLDRGFLKALQDGNHGSQYPRASELGDEGLPYISATDITEDGRIDLSACRRICPERATRLRIPPAQSGDVILTNNATVGRVTRLPEWPTQIVASTSTTYYRCNEDKLDPEYLRWFFESAVFQWQLSTIMRQSTRNQVPITTQKRLLFAVPSIQTQRELAKLRSRFLRLSDKVRDRRNQLAAVKQGLLEALFV